MLERGEAEFRGLQAAEAQAWLDNNEAMMNAGKPLARARVARLVDILAAIKEEGEEGDEFVPPDGLSS